MARAILVTVDNGDDPAVARAIAKRAETFGELWDEYFNRHAKQNKRVIPPSPEVGVDRMAYDS